MSHLRSEIIHKIHFLYFFRN